MYMISHSLPLSLRLDESADAITILRETTRLLPQMPLVIGIFAITAVVSYILSPLGDWVALIGEALAVVVTYRELGGRASTNTSIAIRLFLAVVAGIVAGLVTLIGFVLLIIPGVYLLVRLQLVVPAVMLEDSGPLEALGRSLELTQSHTWTVFGVWFAPLLAGLTFTLGVIVAADGITLSGGIHPAALQSSLQLANALTTLIVMPIAAIATTIMYVLYGPNDVDSG